MASQPTPPPEIIRPFDKGLIGFPEKSSLFNPAKKNKNSGRGSKLIGSKSTDGDDSKLTILPVAT